MPPVRTAVHALPRHVTLLVCLLLPLLAPVSAEADEEPPVPLLLVSLDGFMPAYLQDPAYRDLELPNLRAFLREGSYAEGVENVLPSLTYPAHTTLLTGASPARHGILNNVFLDPLLAKTDTWYWFASDIKLETLWDLAAARGLKTVNMDWPVSVGAPVNVNLPQYWRDDLSLDRRYWLGMAEGARAYLAGAETRLGPYPLTQWTLEADLRRGVYIKDLIAHFKPQFMTAYLSSVDESSHHQGLGSPELAHTLAQIDKLIGEIDGQAKRTYPQGYRLALVSDHGFAMAEHEIRLNCLLKELGLITTDADGKVKDWKAVAWHAEGVAAIMLRDPSDRGTLTRVESALKDLAKRHPQAIDKILNKPEIEALQGFSGAALLVAAKEHYKFTWYHEAPVVGAKASYPATHGFLPEDRKMDAMFMVKGPGIAAGRNLGRIRMVDVAPSLASLLGGKLGSAEGVNVLGAGTRRASR
jgi:predicted AlkP superfamily pyrophosphatase or phosphodiesterase